MDQSGSLPPMPNGSTGIFAPAYSTTNVVVPAVNAETRIKALEQQIVNLHRQLEDMNYHTSRMKMRPYSTQDNDEVCRQLEADIKYLMSGQIPDQDDSKIANAIKIMASGFEAKFAEMEDRINRLNPNFGRF